MISQTLTPHFTWQDVIHSDVAERKGINNTPPDSLWRSIVHTAERMEMLRTKLLTPISVNSWYRSLELNALVGSKFTSQHPKGEAVDWTSHEYGTCIQIVHALIPHIEELQIDQIILEWSWIHTSFCANPNSKPRGNVLTLLTSGGYAPGITDHLGNPLQGDYNGRTS